MRAWPDPMETTVPELFAWRVRETPGSRAYRFHDADAGAWRARDWAGMARRVGDWRRAFAREGLAPGERVAIRLPNGPDWVAFDLAALACGLVTVPLFVSDAPAATARILSDSAPALLLVGARGEWEAIEAASSAPLPLRRVLCMDAPGGTGEARLRSVGGWLAGAAGDAEPPPHRCSPDALATIVYTSGTTGRPKGVMLSHRNMLSVADAILERAPGDARDVFLSYLPLAHVFERVVGYYVPMMIGASVVHGRGIATLREDLAEARPTILLIVPSLLERMHAAVTARARERPLGRWLLGQAVRTGLAVYRRRRDGRAAGPWLWLCNALLQRLAGRAVRAGLGGRLRLGVSGGAALPVPVAEFCLGLGVPLVEGYGLTETASAVCSARLGAYVPGRAGPPLSGMEVRTDARGELLVRSPGTMIGYWNAPDLTGAAFAGGWLRTGDLARIEDGEVRIVGRLKELIVLSKGENVPPAALEAAIALDPLVAQALVVGEGWPHTGAVLVLERAAFEALARGLGLDPKAPDVLESAALKAAALERVARRTADFPAYARPRAVALTLDPWTVSDGLLTPTQKPRRAVLAARLAGTIRRLRDVEGGCEG